MKMIVKKKNTEKFLTVKTGVNGATPTFPSVVTRIKWRSTWYARWSVTRAASGFTGCVGSPRRSTAISSMVIFTKKHLCAPRWNVCTTFAGWYRSCIRNGRTSSTDSSPPSFFMPGNSSWQIKNRFFNFIKFILRKQKYIHLFSWIYLIVFLHDLSHQVDKKKFFLEQFIYFNKLVI